MARTRYSYGDDVIYKGHKTHIKDVYAGNPKEILYELATPKGTIVKAHQIKKIR